MTPAQKRIGAAAAARRLPGALGVDVALTHEESLFLAKVIERAKAVSITCRGSDIYWREYVNKCRSELLH